MDKIDWSKDHILKISNETEYDIADIVRLRGKIEPWLTAIFQSEHLSLLAGSGIVIATTKIAGTTCQAMGRIEFKKYKDEIKAAADEQAKRYGRGAANIEDDFRAALELYQGLSIAELKEATTIKNEIDEKLYEFIKAILNSESTFIKSVGVAEALKYLKNFLFSFASRTATRDRLNIFTTNYDRFIEYACDLAGILILDRFIGKIEPIFRTNKIELDYHYNPPGIRGEPRYVEGVVRYTKIHGSLDWMFYNNQIRKILLPFGAEENHPALPKKNTSEMAVIYPNSSKGIETTFYPYSELFRDFSCAVSQPNSILVVYGYGFGDSHINRIIEDMLIIPSTHVVIISYDKASGRIQQFYEKNNPAQFTLLIGSHYGDMKTLVENYLPKAAIDRITEREHIIKEKRGQIDTKGKGDKHENV